MTGDADVDGQSTLDGDAVDGTVTLDDGATLDDMLVAAVAARPDAPALLDAPNRAGFAGGEPRRLTWAQLDDVVDSTAASLRELGATPGSKVALQLPNVVELPVLLLACFRLGAVAVPFPVQHRAHELRIGFDLAAVTLAVTADRPDRPDNVATVAAVAAEHEATAVALDAVGLDGGSATGSSDSSASFDVGIDVGTRPVATDVATICWTSGTTGTPKGVPRTHAMWGETGRFQVAALGLTADDRLLCPFPLVNMAGIGGMLVPWLLSRSMLVLHQPLDLPVFLGQLQSERITYTVAPPALLNMLLADDSILDGVDLGALRIITSGSAPLDPWMIEGWEARGVEICNAFGSNEGVSMLSTRSSVPDPVQRARLFPAPDRAGVEARLVDLGTGEEITEPGRPGELLFGGPTVFDGYLGSDGSEFVGGMFRSGDIFEWAEPPSGDREHGDDGPRLLRFVDRAKDIIIRGGMNVSAAEVEALISAHPGITECAVVGYPDPVLGERVGVFVVPNQMNGDAKPDLESVIAVMRSADVASYKIPERLEVVDTLPRNPVGKVVKPELRARWT